MSRIKHAAIALVKAEAEMNAARGQCSAMLDRYFAEHGRPAGRMREDDARFAAAFRAVQPYRDEYLRLRRRFYKARQKMRLEVARGGYINGY